jgi:ribosomal-protein-serine acetyltransferase
VEPRDLGDGVRLHLLSLRDAEELFALTDENRDRLRPWFPWVDATPALKQTREFIHAAADERERGAGLQCGIREHGALAGVIGLHRCDSVRRCAELGYWLGAAYEGRGLVSRAAAALCDHAFDKLGLHRLEIRCAPKNERSCAVAARLGFVEDGTLREAEVVNGEWRDNVVYSLLAHERR